MQGLLPVSQTATSIRPQGFTPAQADLYDLDAEQGHGLAGTVLLFIDGEVVSPDPAETMIERLSAGAVDQQALAAWVRAHATPQ